MTFKDYQKIIQETAVYPEEIGIAYCAMGLTGEAGEVADKIKKLYRDDNFSGLTTWGQTVVLQKKQRKYSQRTW